MPVPPNLSTPMQVPLPPPFAAAPPRVPKAPPASPLRLPIAPPASPPRVSRTSPASPLRILKTSRSTIGGVGDTTIPSPGWSTKQPLPLIGLRDPQHGRQACPKSTSFHQGVDQICPREGLFSCRSLPKRGQICDIPDPPNR